MHSELKCLVIYLLTTKKPGLNTNDLKSFRPITLNDTFEALETSGSGQAKPHVMTSPNYTPLQSTYRAAHSTETALVKIVDVILSIVDSGSPVALVGLDISAAFDTVSHRKLLARLEHDFSIEGVAREWINSYLSKRTFFVRVGRSSSVVAQMFSVFWRASGLCAWAHSVHCIRISNRKNDRALRRQLP